MAQFSAFLSAALCLSSLASSADISLSTSDYFDEYCAEGYGDYSNIDEFNEEWGESAMYIPWEGSNKKMSKLASYSPSNLYDTYNAGECQRVRKSWNSLSDDERNLYIDGLLELRVRGELDMNLDDLVAVASVHDDHFGSVTHMDSDYLFWHGYLIWELESRIRNLGGKYSCFGMPYWDFTNEYNRDQDEIPFIYQTGLGGFGDPDNFWAVNGYSWDITTKQYWSPIQKDVSCEAEGDECPICALKRPGTEFENLNKSPAKEHGEAIVGLSNFVDFQRWITTSTGLPHAVDNSYDPIWYLFHSMQSYYQAMWVNCNEYDEIDTDHLDEHQAAFTPYCLWDNQTECVGIKANDPLYFGGVLSKRPWSFVHNEVLTIAKLYSFPQWNIIYDLSGDAFFQRSGLNEACKDKLNPNWFILPTDDDDANERVESNVESKWHGYTLNMISSSNVINVTVFVTVIIMLCILSFNKWRQNTKSSKIYDTYGSIVNV